MWNIFKANSKDTRTTKFSIRVTLLNENMSRLLTKKLDNFTKNYDHHSFLLIMTLREIPNYPKAAHCVKSVQIQSFFSSVFFHIWTESLFSPDAGKYRSLSKIKCHCCPHIKTSPLTCGANQLTDFHIRATQGLNGLIFWYSNNVSHDNVVKVM